LAAGTGFLTGFGAGLATFFGAGFLAATFFTGLGAGFFAATFLTGFGAGFAAFFTGLAGFGQRASPLSSAPLSLRLRGFLRRRLCGFLRLFLGGQNLVPLSLRRWKNGGDLYA
jgi:hypothetical protein